MASNRKTLFRLAVAFLAFHSHPSLAAIDCNAGSYTARFEQRYDRQCLDADKLISQRIAEASTPMGDYKGESSNAEWVSKGRKALNDYATVLAAARAKAQKDENAKLVQDLVDLASILSRANDKLAADMTLAKLGLPETDRGTPELGIDFWDPIGGSPPGKLASSAIQKENCADERTPTLKCDRAFAISIAVGDHVQVIKSIIARIRLPLRVEILEKATARTGRWDAYLYETEFQFWWELALNRYFESKCPKGLHATAARLLSREEFCQKRERDVFGNELGFREPPNFKAIFLHPDVGAMYLEAEPDGDRAKPALIVQVFGYEWWKWEDAEIHDRRRISIVGTLADTAVAEEYGIGLQFGWSDYALAVTTHGGDLAVSLNIGLLGKVSTVNSRRAEELKDVLPQ